MTKKYIIIKTTSELNHRPENGKEMQKKKKLLFENIVIKLAAGEVTKLCAYVLIVFCFLDDVRISGLGCIIKVRSNNRIT